MSKEELKYIQSELDKERIKHIVKEIKIPLKKELVIKSKEEDVIMIPVEKLKNQEKEDIIMIPSSDENEVDYKMLRNLIKTKGCFQLFSALKDVKILQKTSVSDSIIIFGNLEYKAKNILKNFNVALKVVYKPLNPLENSLLVENQIYENIISDLKYNEHTSHIVDFIGSYDECDLPLHQFNKQIQKKFDVEKKKIKELKKYDMKKATVIVTLKSSGNYLLEKFDKYDTNHKLIVIFQVLYTLLCFNHRSLKHNDLHWGNIFVDEYRFPRSYSYNLNSYIFTIKSFISIFIYDFDRSSVYHPAVDRNFMNDTVNFCKQFNQCNGINNKMDFQAFLGTLIKYELPIEIQKWINSITSEDFRYRLKNRYYPQYIEGEIEISDKDLKPLNESLKLLLDIVKQKSFYSKGSDENKIIYKLPKEYKITHEYIISHNTHPSYGLVRKTTLKEHPSDKQFNELIRNRIEIYNNDLAKLYFNEYLKLSYNINENTVTLFKHFFLLKPVEDHIQEYIRTCFVMSLPFWYKLNVDIKNILFKILFNTLYSKLIEDDIWNVFQGRLPIKFPILSYS